MEIVVDTRAPCGTGVFGYGVHRGETIIVDLDEAISNV